MKICPTCRKTYEDAAIVFCLDDGASLREIKDSDPDATWYLAQPPGSTVRAPSPSPRPTVPVQATITARPDQYQVATPNRAGDPERDSNWKSALPWVFGIVVVLSIAGVLVAWLLTRNGDDHLAKNESPTPPPSASTKPTFGPTVEPTKSPAVNLETPGPTPIEPATPEPTKEKPKSMFAVLNNTGFNGSRITYYPRPSFGQCQADCAANGNCQGFTWIRPGAYNPGDSAMCYLMSEITARKPDVHSISGVRN
jgi:PAN domain-containing protein